MLKIENVTLKFNAGTEDETVGLDNLSLHLNHGDFCTVIGTNGSGKSTLMNAVSGSYTTDSGRIIIDGEDVTMMPEHRRSRFIGRLFQDPMKGTAPGMTIEENLALAAGIGGWFSMTSKAERELFREKLSMLDMGLEDRLKSRVGTLSGGQRQALTLLMATFNTPKLLLLDEHTAALDPNTAEKVLKVTEDVVREKSITCMMITHNISDALRLGNRTIMMNKGKIIYDVSGEERASLTVKDILDRFHELSGKHLDDDKMLLDT